MKASRIASVVGIAVAAAFAGSVSAQQLKMMTGPQGGSWYPPGGAIQGIIEKNVPGASMQVLPGAGISNVIGVNAGKADLGFGNAVSSVDGVNGREPFKGKQDNVCQVATLYFQFQGDLNWISNWALWSMLGWSDMGAFALDGRSILTRWPAASDWRKSSAPSGSTPTTVARGNPLATARA